MCVHIYLTTMYFACMWTKMLQVFWKEQGRAWETGIMLW